MKNKFFLFLVLFVFSVGFVYAENLQKQVNGFKYELLVPDSYNEQQSYPLVVAFHWSGGRGKDMIDRWQKPAGKKKYIVACPNSKNKKEWRFSEKDNVFEMIDQIKSKYSIDQDKIFLMGFSGGAMFTYYLGLNNPSKFKAIACYAGSLRRLGGKVKLSKNKQLPVFIIHGGADKVVNISESRWAKKRLEKFGYQVKLTELRSEQHNYAEYITWHIINWFDRL